MTCLEYVMEITKKYKKDYQNEILDKLFMFETLHNIVDKDAIPDGLFIVFVQQKHIGFAKVAKEYNELQTYECSDDKVFNRVLSLYDDSIHIIDILVDTERIEKILKRSVKNETN